MSLHPVEAIVFKHLNKRPHCPGTEYHGDRPCLWWPPLLMRLAAQGLLCERRYRLTAYARKLRPSK